MRGYSDRTADNAVGAADKEFRQMARLALALRLKNNNPAWEEEQTAKFTGIFKRLLTDPIDEVKQAAGR